MSGWIAHSVRSLHCAAFFCFAHAVRCRRKCGRRIPDLRPPRFFLMSFRTLVLSLLLLGAASGSHVRAQGVPNAAAALAARDELMDRQMKGIMEKIRAKLSSGPHTEAALLNELTEFDAVLESHKGEKSEAVARANFMRAMLYVDVFRDFDKAAKLLEQMKVDFIGRQAATAADQVLTQVRQQQESFRIEAALAPGAVFPDFTERDLSGQPLSVSRYRGKVVLVDFWATWCGPCVAELPNVLATYEKYHGQGFEIVGISLDNDADKLKGFIAAKNIAWPQYYDGQGWEGKLARKYGVTAIPTTYLLDQDGKIVAKGLRGAALSAEVEGLLAKR